MIIICAQPLFLDNYSTDTFESLNLRHRFALTRTGSGDVNHRATLNAFRADILSFLVGDVSEQGKMKFQKVSLANIARKCHVLENPLLAALQRINVQPFMRGEVPCFAVGFSSKILFSGQYGKTDVFARGCDGEVGRYLFSIKEATGRVAFFFERMQPDTQERRWRCTEEIIYFFDGQILDVVSLVHDCLTHGCLNDVWQRLCVLARTNRPRTKIRNPEGDVRALIRQNRNRLHRVGGPLYLQNFD